MSRRRKSVSKSKSSSPSGLVLVVLGILAVIYAQNYFDVTPVLGTIGAHSRTYTDVAMTDSFKVYCYGSQDPITGWFTVDEGVYDACSGIVTENSNYLSSISCNVDGRYVYINAHLTSAGESFCAGKYDDVVGKGKITLDKVSTGATDECSSAGTYTCDYGDNDLLYCYRASDGVLKYRVYESCSSDEVCTLSGCESKVSPPEEVTPPPEEVIDYDNAVDVVSMTVSTPSLTDYINIGDVVTIYGTFHVNEGGTYVFEGALHPVTTARPATYYMPVRSNYCRPDEHDHPSALMTVKSGVTYGFEFKAVAMRSGTFLPQVSVHPDCSIPAIDAKASSDVIYVKCVEEPTPVPSALAVEALQIIVNTPDGSNEVHLDDKVTIYGKFKAHTTGTYMFEGALFPYGTMSIVNVYGNALQPTDKDYPSKAYSVIAGNEYEFSFDSYAMRLGKVRPQISVWNYANNQVGSQVGDGLVSDSVIEVVEVQELAIVDIASMKVETSDGSSNIIVGDKVRITAVFDVSESGTYIFEGALPRPSYDRSGTASIVPVISRNVCNPDDIDYPSVQKEVEAGKRYELTFEATSTETGVIIPQVTVWTKCGVGGEKIDGMSSSTAIAVTKTGKKEVPPPPKETNMLMYAGIAMIILGLVMKSKERSSRGTSYYARRRRY